MNRLLIVGAGGFGREVLIYAREIQSRKREFEIGGFLDSNPEALAGFDTGAAILGHEADWKVGKDDIFVVALGSAEKRAGAHAVLAARGARFQTLVHPMAWIAPSARLGAGTVVAPFASVNADAVVGENVLLNSHVAIGHDARIGGHVIVSPFTVVTGAAQVGERSFIGSGSVIGPSRILGRHTTVAAGSVVYRNVPDNEMAIGNPAKIHAGWKAVKK